jgi:hypothetical protein
MEDRKISQQIDCVERTDSKEPIRVQTIVIVR